MFWFPEIVNLISIWDSIEKFDTQSNILFYFSIFYFWRNLLFFLWSKKKYHGIDFDLNKCICSCNFENKNESIVLICDLEFFLGGLTGKGPIIGPIYMYKNSDGHVKHTYNMFKYRKKTCTYK